MDSRIGEVFRLNSKLCGKKIMFHLPVGCDFSVKPIKIEVILDPEAMITDDITNDIIYNDGIDGFRNITMRAMHKVVHTLSDASGIKSRASQEIMECGARKLVEIEYLLDFNQAFCAGRSNGFIRELQSITVNLPDNSPYIKYADEFKNTMFSLKYRIAPSDPNDAVDFINETSVRVDTQQLEQGDFLYFLELDKLVYIRYINHGKQYGRSSEERKAYLVYQSDGKLVYHRFSKTKEYFDDIELNASSTHAFICTKGECLMFIGTKC